MGFQKQVNKQLALGKVGEFYDDSPRRVTPVNVIGTTSAKAKATLTTTGNFSANDTVTIGVQTYKFVASLTSSPSTIPYEVVLGASASASLTNLEKAINGTGTAGTEYSVGTEKNALATASATTSTLVVTAKADGAEGNSVAVAETSSSATFGTDSTLAGGTDEVKAKIGVAFTFNAEGEARVGGTGVFMGIAVNPEDYAIYNNFNPTMEIPSGIAGQLCTFGHILVKVTDSITVGQVAFYNNNDGTIKGGTAGASVAGYTEIKNSKFINFNAGANEVAVLELGQ